MNDFCEKTKYLGHPWADLDETLRVDRVDPEILHRNIFDFRSEVKTGSQPSANDIVFSRFILKFLFTKGINFLLNFSWRNSGIK